MQIVTIGRQDEYILGNPQITFFKSVYRRHTNFAIESIPQIINGENNTENTETNGTVTISKTGDLLSKLSIVCPQTTEGINGSELIDEVDIIIGGTLIDRHTNEWMKVWSELSTPAIKTEGYQYMTGGYSSTSVPSTDQSLVIVPLHFWFCRYIGLSIPLIALQYHDILVKIKWGINSDINRDGSTSRSSLCELWADYIFLDQEERAKFSSIGHEYLIEQVQNIDTSISSPSTKYKLNMFNHPIKELIWVEGNTGVDRITDQKMTLTFNGLERFQERSKEYFTLKQPYDHHTSIPGYNIKESRTPVMLDVPINSGITTHSNSSPNGVTTVTVSETSFTYAINQSIPFKIGDTFITSIEPASTSAGVSCGLIHKVTSISSTVVTFTPSIPSVPSDGDTISVTIFARKYNPQSRCSTLSKNIYVYSFCINPEDHQPSGICNFSLINDIKLTINESKKIDHIYAINYNILRITSGLASMVYTN